jgi:predicted PurR-regulated permease PerM
MDLGKQESVKKAIDIAISLGVLFGIILVSFLIAKPFLGIIAWSAILAVALFPFIEKMSKRLNLSRKRVAISFAIIANLALIVPTYMVSNKAIDSVVKLREISQNGEFKIQAPPQKVKEWPLVGEKVFAIWDSSSKNLEETIKYFSPQIKSGASAILKSLGSSFSMVLMSMVSIVIAVVFIIGAQKHIKFCKRIATILIGEKGEEWANLVALTIRSVASGVIGVALIQAVLSFLGLVLMDVPFSLLIALAIMFLAIIQLPPIIVIGPVIAFVLSYDTSTMAMIFAVYLFLVGASDNILKPMLMGRGVDIPMLVILIGAIGGMLLMGMIGLFVGAVIFAIFYKLMMLWLSEEDKKQEA